MSGLQKRLAFILPILACTTLLAWWLGTEHGEKPDTTPQQQSAAEGERYQVAKQPQKLVLPAINLEFLGEVNNAKIASVLPEKQKNKRVVFEEIGDGAADTTDQASEAGKETQLPVLSTNVFAPGSRSGKSRFRAPAIELVEPSETENETIGFTEEIVESEAELQSVLKDGENVSNVTMELPAIEEDAFEPTPALPPLPPHMTSNQGESQLSQTTENLEAQTDSKAFVVPQPIDPVERVESMEIPRSMQAQIAQRLEYASSLARRGAFSSAEEIYFQVIRLIAETKDSQIGGRDHTTALANALTAFEEAEDFITNDLKVRVRMKIENVVASHNTPLLQEYDCTGMTSIQALQSYYEYAGQELTNATAGESIASEALYQLGKMYSTHSRYNRGDSATQNAKSMIVHQAALASSPTNYLAGNELGVLLARYGRLDDAKEILIHSVSISPQSTTWRNLAVVHERLNEPNLARLAKKEAEIVSSEYKNRSEKEKMIQWVDHATFEKIGGKRDEFAQQSTREIEPEAPETEQKKPATRTASGKKEWWRLKR